jgi:prevent-host-death family protein
VYWGAGVTTVAIEQAQKELSRLIDDVALGERIVITKNQVPVAELVPVTRPVPKPTFGSAKGMVTMSEDFDAPIDDFQDYMDEPAA